MQHQQHAQSGLSHPAMLILASLVQGPKHAVALCEAIEQTEGLFFEPGTLYRVLAHLEQRCWIEALRTEQPLRLYQITALGLLAFERADMHRQGEKLLEGRASSLAKRKGDHHAFGSLDAAPVPACLARAVRSGNGRAAGAA